MQNKAREEIIEIISKNKIEYSVLSSWTGIDYDVLWRQYNTAKHYREDVHQKVVKGLRKRGFITSSDEQIERLKIELIDGGAIINGAISLINKSFLDKISDNVFSESDKKELKSQIKQLQNRINDSFDNWVLTINQK